MTESKHTPGPWKYRRSGGDAESGYYIDGEHDHSVAALWGKPEEEALANARLIAAAPTLLEAADEADTAFAVLKVCREADLSPQAWSALYGAWEKINRALAEATGKPGPAERADAIREAYTHYKESKR